MKNILLIVELSLLSGGCWAITLFIFKYIELPLSFLVVMGAILSTIYVYCVLEDEGKS